MVREAEKQSERCLNPVTDHLLSRCFLPMARALHPTSCISCIAQERTRQSKNDGLEDGNSRRPLLILQLFAFIPSIRNKEATVTQKSHQGAPLSPFPSCNIRTTCAISRERALTPAPTFGAHLHQHFRSNPGVHLKESHTASVHTREQFQSTQTRSLTNEDVPLEHNSCSNDQRVIQSMKPH